LDKHFSFFARAVLVCIFKQDVRDGKFK
jgi:hypothetical protein